MTEDENNLNPQAASPTPAPQQTQPSPVPPAPQVGQGGPVPPSGYTPSQAQPQASGFNGAVQPQAQAQPQPQAQSAPNAYAPYATPPQPASAPAPEKKKSRGWIVAIVVVVALLIVLLVSITSCTSMVKSIVGPSSSGIEITNDANSVAVIDIDGTIQYDGTSNSPEGFKQLLDEAADDDNTIAVVLRVNSGGGTATAGEEMAAYLKEFREDTGKPVVVSSASLNASAAYMISSQADAIFVARTTEIGAIGTAMQSTDFSGLLEKLGISVDNITSSEGKDSSYGTRPLTEEERAYYQNMVDEINEVFIEIVADGRGKSVSWARSMATGMVFTGQTAVKNGIADEIGTLEDACAYAAKLAGARSYSTYDLHLSGLYDFSSLSSLLGESESDSDLALLLKERSEHAVQ